MLKRHEVEILLKAGHPKTEVARLAGVSLCSVKRIAEETPVVHVDDATEREKRQIGRPSLVENFRKLIVAILEEKPDLPSLEILRRVREAGYLGGKTALYALVASLRPKGVKPLVRFEGLPGEFSQHDFGQVDVEFLDGMVSRVHFFASRLKYSRYIRVGLVKNETVESLVRNLAEHLHSWGGVPLMCVFDRPKTVVLKWRRNGEVTEWNPVFAYAMPSGRFQGSRTSMRQRQQAKLRALKEELRRRMHTPIGEQGANMSTFRRETSSGAFTAKPASERRALV